MSTRSLQIECLLTPVIDYRDGSVASGYTVYFYAAGTSTPKNVWTEKEKTNPYTSRTLGSDGTVQVYGDGVYKIIIKDGDGTTVYEWDNVKVQYPNIAVLSKSGTYTATVDDDYILVGATMTLNLYAAASFTHPICVKLTGSYTLTIDPDGSELIEGASTYTLSTANAAVWLFSNGSAWYVGNAVSVSATDAINLVASVGGSAKLTAKSATIDIETNNEYLRQLDNAGTDYVDLIKANASDQIELGAKVKNITLLNTGLHILDTDASHDIILKPGSDVSADRTISLITGDSNGTIPFPMFLSQFNRSKFTYNGGATAYTIKAGAANYFCKDKYCFWDSELTTTAISSPVADTLYYLYLDYSAITSGTAITNSELIWSTTAPSWNGTYKAWMNGDDRCIMAVLSNGVPNNILEFFHDGGELVIYSDYLTTTLTPTDIDDTWTDVTISPHLPGFCTKALVTPFLEVKTTDGTVIAYWRVNGQSGATAHFLVGLERIGTDQYVYGSSMPIMTDSSQVFEARLNRSDADTLGVYVDGWFFPGGI